MKLTLHEEDILPKFRSLPAVKIQYKHLSPAACKAIKAAGKAGMWLNRVHIKDIYPPSATHYIGKPQLSGSGGTFGFEVVHAGRLTKLLAMHLPGHAQMDQHNISHPLNIFKFNSLNPLYSFDEGNSKWVKWR